MSDYYSDLDLEDAAEPCQDTSSCYVGSVSVAAGESVAWAQLTEPMGMREASASSEGAASAAGSGNILGNKRNISEVTERSEEEKSFRDQIKKKIDQIEALAEELNGYKAQLKTIEADIEIYKSIYLKVRTKDNFEVLNMFITSKKGMDEKISSFTANLTQKERELAKARKRAQIFKR